MKKAIAMILALCVLAALSGCGQNTPEPEQPTEPGAIATPEPVYTAADFAGHWTVSEVYDVKGQPVTGSELTALGSFTLELLADGTYFVYDAAETALGQGSYALSGKVLTLSAGSLETSYEVTDINTLRCKSEDGSVTVLTRLPEEPEENMEEDIIDDEVPDDGITEGGEEGTEEPLPEDTIEEETDLPEDEGVPVETEAETA